MKAPGRPNNDALIPVGISALKALPMGSVASYGGKAASLGRLAREAAMHVPEGIAIAATTRPPSSWPPELREELRERVDELLREGPVAVRSSALGEDSPERSFAGLFASFLTVATQADVFQAVGDCIASGANQKVLAYNDGVPLPVGVVIQQMADAQTAGVLFTRDPTGRDPALVLEAIHGLGEALVSGEATPWRWRIYRAGTGELVQRCEQRGDDQPPLKATTLNALAEQAWALADRWEQALDVEWAIEPSGRICWLQARPITAGESWQPPTVSRSSATAERDDGPVSVWSNFNIRESLPEPISPLDWSLWREQMVPLITHDTLGVSRRSSSFDRLQLMDLVDSRVYINLNAVVARPQVKKMLPKMAAFLDQRAADTIGELLSEDQIPPRAVPRDTLIQRLGQLIEGVGQMRQRLRVLRHPEKALEQLEEAGRRCAQRGAVEELDDEALLRELQLLLQPETEALRLGFRTAGLAVMLWFIAEQQFAPWPEARDLLTTGIENNPTTMITMGIEQLTEQAQPLKELFAADTSELLGRLHEEAAHRAEVQDWLDELERFLDAYGHRGPRELELQVPRWREDPTMVLQLVQMGLRNPSAETLTTRLPRLASRRDAAVAQAIAAAPWWKRPLLRWLARKLQHLMPFREGAKHHIMQAFFRMRQAAVALGERLASRGHLATFGDIFFLDLDELKGLVTQSTPSPPAPQLIAARREAVDRARSTDAPEFLRSDGIPIGEEPASTEQDGLYSGVGIGGTSAQGRVKVLHTPDPQRLEPGDILVVRFADPGWTPLFPLVSGLVMEVGGLMCHAAVIARELRLPAVFGVKGATHKLHDGDLIRIDGTRGTVTLVPEEPAIPEEPQGREP